MSDEKKGQDRLQCHACGSTDVTIDAPWYRCNHCGTRHPLPPEHAQYERLKSKFKKRYIAILLVLLVLGSGVGYLYWSMARLNPSPSVLKEQKPSRTFPNMVLNRDWLNGIRLFRRTPQGNYLLAGSSGSNASLQLYLLSPEGKVLWGRALERSFHVDAACGEDGKIVLTYHHLDHGGWVLLDKTGKMRVRKPFFYTALARGSGEIVGVSGGTIEARDERGALLWRRVIDARTVTRRAGAHLDEHTGKMVPYTKVFDRLDLQHIIRLKKGGYVALGIDDRADVAVVRFDDTGMVIRNERYDFGRTWIDAVTATEDGGFAMVARSGLRFFKFDATGTLQYRRDLDTGGHAVYSYALVETQSGYMIASSIGQGARLELFNLDKSGRQVGHHSYAKKGVRLHPRHLVKAPRDGYLLTVTTELHESWIVHVRADGVLEADLDDPTRFARLKPPQHLLEDTCRPGDILPTHTPLTSPAPPLHTVTVPTQRFLGARIDKIIPSKDGRTLYAITGATGFKIFRRNKAGVWQQASMLLRTRTPLRITPNRIAPKDGKIPKRGSPYGYDHPTDLKIAPDEKLAYVADYVHGFYVVDMADIEHPKILAAARELKLHAFALSGDGERIFYSDQGGLRSVRISEILAHPSVVHGQDRGEQAGIVSLDDGRKLLVSDRNFLMLYDADSGALIGQQNVGASRLIRRLHSNGGQYIYFQTSSTEVEIMRLGAENSFERVAHIPYQNPIRNSLLFPDRKLLCATDKEGIVCMDYHDPLNPIPTIRYRNKGFNGGVALAYDPANGAMIVAFEDEKIGVVGLNSLSR